MQERLFTDFLFSDGSIVAGAATVLDIGAFYFRFNKSATPSLADARALRQDFAMIGQDVQDVATALEAQQGRQMALSL